MSRSRSAAGTRNPVRRGGEVRSARSGEAGDMMAGGYAYLAELGRRGLEGLHADRMIEEIPARLAEAMQVDAAQIVLCRRGRDMLDLVSAHGIDAVGAREDDVGPRTVLGWTLRQAEPIDIFETGAPRPLRLPGFLEREAFASGLAVAIGGTEGPLGVICVETRSDRAFDAADRDFLRMVANVLGAALQRAASDEQKRLLLDELRHRVRNMLASVQSVSSLSLRDAGIDPAVRARLTDRIRVLALAHDLNFRRDDALVDIAELVRIQVAPYDPAGGRLTISGTSTVRLKTGTVIDMSMVVHELAANALRHGAFSNRAGRVAIEIASRRDAGRDRVTIAWTETGDLVPTDGPREGSGSKLLRAVGRQPEFDIDWSLRPDGLRCRIGVTL